MDFKGLEFCFTERPPFLLSMGTHKKRRKAQQISHYPYQNSDSGSFYLLM